MKRSVMGLFLFGVMMMTPFHASAMDVISDSEMNAISSQTGVEIWVHNFHMDLHITNIAWGDTDGKKSENCHNGQKMVVGGSTVVYYPGYVNINNMAVKNAYFSMPRADN